MIDTSGIIDFLLKLSALGKKKAAAKIIYSAEKSSNVAGLQSKDILQSLNNELKGNEFIDAIIKPLYQGKGAVPASGIRVYTDHALKQISRGKPKSVAYRDVLAPDVVSMLKTAESKGVAVRDIFKTFTKMQPIIAKAESKMRNAMSKPTIIYAAVGIMCYFIVTKFFKNFANTPKADLSSIKLISQYYLPLIAFPIVSLHIILNKFPDKVPIWNRVYRYMKGSSYLLITKTLMECGMNAADVIAFFSKLPDQRLQNGIDKLKKDEKDMGGLTEALSPYLEIEEVAQLKISVKSTEQQRVLTDIVDQRMLDIDEHVSAVTTGFSEGLLGLVLIPIGLAAYTIYTIMTKVTLTLKL